jgi:hypothetical protein
MGIHIARMGDGGMHPAFQSQNPEIKGIFGMVWSGFMWLRMKNIGGNKFEVL